MSALEPNEYCCVECGLLTNRDHAPSPCETHRVCGDCAEANGADHCANIHADELLREALRPWGAA